MESGREQLEPVYHPGSRPGDQVPVDEDDVALGHGGDAGEPGPLRDHRRALRRLRRREVDLRPVGDQVLDRPLRIVALRVVRDGVAAGHREEAVHERVRPDRGERRVVDLEEAGDALGDLRCNRLGAVPHVVDEHLGHGDGAGHVPHGHDVEEQIAELSCVQRDDRHAEVPQLGLPGVTALDREEQVGLERDDTLDVRIHAEVAGTTYLLHLLRLDRIVVERASDPDEPIPEAERVHDLGHRGRERDDALGLGRDRHLDAVVVDEREGERGLGGGQDRRIGVRGGIGPLGARGTDERDGNERRDDPGEQRP
ncbi:MAG: hypothetical protein A2Z48_02050 [Actinobacteria bacterium RBG_19FT_COMBO_70_19]|nr:MAG: hypothetical protein A2Z48_02050 [Actinobacteria bacterium RBG_19FT_COMBO_70_19]